MIWMIGGTKNAIDICRLLLAKGYPMVVSVTTDYGRQLATLTGAEVIQGKLNAADMDGLIISRKVSLIVDASHPFAAEVSQNAISAAQRNGIAYVRFERPNPVYEATYVADYAGAVDYLLMTTGNILLTTGSKNIDKFMPLGVDRLFARVLSSSDSIVMCEQAGLEASRIIGLSGVCSVELNAALMTQFNIRYLVTKESGVDGGVGEKVEAARRVGAEVVIIKRPKIHYPEIYSDQDSLIAQIEGCYK